MRYLIFLLIPLLGFSQPSNFIDHTVRINHIEFDWSADGSAVSYEIYKDDVLYGTSTSLSFIAYDLITDTNFKFKIRSVFSNGSKSNFSDVIDVRTGLYPIERTAFTTAAHTNRATPSNGTSYTNLFGLYERAVTNDVGYPRGDNSDYWGYPRAASFTIDGNYIASEFPYTFWNVSDYSRNSTLTGTTSYYWKSTNPLYPNRSYANGNSRTFSIVDNGTQIFSREFTTFNSSSKLTPTGEDGMSFDNNIWAFQDNAASNKVIVYNVETNTIIKEFDTGVDVLDGWMSISANGNYLLVARQATTGSNFIDVYTITSNDVVFLRRDTFGFGHADLGISMQGNEVIVYRDGGNLKMMRHDNGAITQLLGGNTSSTWFLIGHISCKNVLQPGWAYTNSNDGDNNTYESTPVGTSRRYSFNKIIGVKLDENSTGYGTTIFREYAVSNINANGYATPSPSGEILAANNVDSSGRDIGMFIQQQNLIGDEIPFGGEYVPPITIPTLKKKVSSIMIN